MQEVDVCGKHLLNLVETRSQPLCIHLEWIPAKGEHRCSMNSRCTGVKRIARILTARVEQTRGQRSYFFGGNVLLLWNCKKFSLRLPTRIFS